MKMTFRVQSSEFRAKRDAKHLIALCGTAAPGCVNDRGRGRSRRIMLMMAIFISSFAISPIVAFAEGPKVLTLDQALGIAMEHNRDIQKAVEYQNWIKGKYVEERAVALPELTMTAYKRRDSDATMADLTMGLFPTIQDTKMADVSLKQTVFAWGKLGAAVRAARIGLKTGDENLRLFRQAVRRDVTEAFDDVLLSKELLDIARQALAQKERHLDEARKKYELGTATDYDVLAAEVSLANARPDVIRSENGVHLARLRLQFLLGADAGEVDAAGTLEAEPLSPPVYGDALQTAYHRRPDLVNQGYTIKINEELIRIYNSGDRPHVDLSAAYGKKWLSAGSLDASGNIWFTALTLSFPLFDGLRTRGQVRQARSNLESSKLDEAKLRESVALQLQGALDNVGESAEILKALSGTVKEAQRLLEMSEKGFDLGVKTRLDVDDAQLNLSAARGNLARARRDYLVALVTLQWVQGTLGEE